MILKAVLFDMDGVIVDTEPLHRKAYFAMFSNIGIKVSEDLFTSFTGRTTESVCKELVSTYNLSQSYTDLIQIKRAFFKDLFNNDPDFDLLPGVRNLIENYYQNGIKLVLASSASQTTINMVFDKFNLHQYFMGKISGADLEASKPHPEIFIKAAEIANEPRENCVVIEDSTNGILAAYDANIYCVAYRSQNSHLQDYSKASIVIDLYEEIYTENLNNFLLNKTTINQVGSN